MTVSMKLCLPARNSCPPDLGAVICYVVWDRYFGKAPDVIGGTLTVAGLR
jgi:hypothetical protein